MGGYDGMRLNRKFKTFINSSNKFELMKDKIRGLSQPVFYSLTFKHFGKYSQIIKPIRIFGKKHISIGSRVSILNNARIEVITNWNEKKYKPHIYIGDRVSIGQNFHLTAADKLIIGEDVTILGNVFITDIDHDYKKIGTNILNQELIISHTEIGDNSFIGFGASIQAGTVLGKQCIVGTNAVVRGKFDDYSVIVGAPARVVKKYNPITGIWEKYNDN